VPFDRPDSWNFPLLLHVTGAMLLVGSTLLVASTLIGAWRSGEAALVRSGFRLMLVAVIPSFLLMRASAEWIYSKEGWDEVDPTPSWLGTGFGVSDFSLLFIIVATVAAGLAVRRLNRGGEGPAISARIATGCVSLMLVAYLVAVWAMTTKPT
jgi:uncharacterized membrane protein